MSNSGMDYFYIALGLFLLVFLIANLYWGTFMLLLAQPLFITVASEGAGIGVTKVIYGVLFFVWFLAWAVKPVTRDTTRPALYYSLRAPALAFGAVLGLGVIVGLLYGTNPGYIAKDLSQYMGYLAVLPLLDLVRTPKQAKRLLFFMAALGLPSSILFDVGAVAGKQDIELSPALMVLTYGAPYWGPFQGAAWAVAVSFPGAVVKLLAWVWIILKGSLSVVSGFRHMLLTFFLSALTAFVVTGRIARHSLARYVIPVILIIAVGGLLADLSGVVKLPLSNITRDRYSTLLSEKSLVHDESVEGRINESKSLFQGFLKNPVTGLGLGYPLRVLTASGKLTPKSFARFRYHNGYLETLMKFGLIGAVIFAWYFLTFLRLAFEVVRISDNYLAKAMGLGLIIYLVPALAASLAGSYFSDKGFSLTLGVMAGLLPALTFQHEEVRVLETERAVLSPDKLKQQVSIPRP